MTTISTTDLRIHIADVLDDVSRRGRVVGIERRDRVEAYLVPAPPPINTDVSEITNINAQSPSFGWLNDEPDLYSKDDCIEVYR